MTSSERRIVAVRKIEEGRLQGHASHARATDTIPAPPPSDHDTERFDRGHGAPSAPEEPHPSQHHPDTIPAGQVPQATDVVVIPPPEGVRGADGAHRKRAVLEFLGAPGSHPRLEGPAG
jgi:hypothetical protein